MTRTIIILALWIPAAVYNTESTIRHNQCWRAAYEKRGLPYHFGTDDAVGTILGVVLGPFATLGVFSVQGNCHAFNPETPE